MANNYSAPNFNLDTSTNVAGLTALKGSAPALTDVIYIYDGATLTIESALSCLKIYTGQTSAGATGANNRYGLIVVNAGVTVTFAGNATNTNSGIQMNPTSADASSKGCLLTINGTEAQPVIFTNSVGGNNTNNRWCINCVYGQISSTFLTANYYYAQVFFLSSISTRCNSPSVITDTTCSASGTNFTFIQMNIAGMDQSIDIRRLTVDISTTFQYFIFNGLSGFAPAAGFSVDVSGLRTTGTASSQIVVPLQFRLGSSYLGQCKFSLADIRPTTIIPTGLTFSDPALDGELRFTITNITSYANSDEICIHNNADNALLACIDVSRYNSLGYGIVPGLTNGVTYTLKARATSDNNTYSEYSGTATGTPTALPPENHTADEVLKSAGGNYNDDNLITANVRSGTAFGLAQTGALSVSGALLPQTQIVGG